MNMIQLTDLSEPDSFESIVHEHSGRMLSVARRFLRNEQDAQDAVQDALLSALRTPATFQGQSHISTWLHRIVVNFCLMRLRTQRRRPMQQMEYESDGRNVNQFSQRDATHGDDTPIEQIMNDELRAHVRSCIDKLPEPYRTVVILRDIEERDTQEAAELLDVSESVVKTRLHRARRALRTLLEPTLVSA